MVGVIPINYVKSFTALVSCMAPSCPLRWTTSASKGSRHATSISPRSFPSKVKSNESGDFDNYFAKYTSCQIFERLVHVVERVGLIDNRAELVLVQECVHAIKRRTRRNGDATNRGLEEDQRHEAQQGGLAGEKADLSDLAGGFGCQGTVSNPRLQPHQEANRRLWPSVSFSTFSSRRGKAR